MTEDQDQDQDKDQETTDHPVVGFVKENKVGVTVGSVLLIAAVIYSTTLGGGSAEPTAVPTVSSTAQLGPGTASPSASPTATPRPTGTPSQSSEPEASQAPSEEPSASASSEPAAVPEKETGADNQTKAPEGTVVGNHDQTPGIKKWEGYAEDFAVAWADTSGGKDAWLKRLDPLITDELHDSFSYTDIRSLFDDTFVNIVADEEDKAAYKIFTAKYEENGALFQGLITLQPDGSWKVDTIAPPED